MKQLFKITFLLACVASAFYLGTSENKEVHDLAINNIEALAREEGSSGSVHCFGSGSVDCLGYKVSYRFDNYSLEDFE